MTNGLTINCAKPVLFIGAVVIFVSLEMAHVHWLSASGLHHM